MGPVNYEVRMAEKKRLREFHINMLRKWHTPTDTSYWAAEESVGVDPEDEWEQMEIPQAILGLEEAGVEKVNVNLALPLSQQVELRDLVAEFSEVFSLSRITTQFLYPSPTSQTSRILDRSYGQINVKDRLLHWRKPSALRLY